MGDFPNVDTPEPVGPIWTGGFESTVVSQGGVDYTLLYLPDKHNDIMQQSACPRFIIGFPTGYGWRRNPTATTSSIFCTSPVSKPAAQQSVSFLG